MHVSREGHSSLQLAEVEREGVRQELVHITANNYRIASGPAHRDFPPTSLQLSDIGSLLTSYRAGFTMTTIVSAPVLCM